MKVHKGLDLQINIPNAVVTSGTFDGVHLGHQFVLNQVKERAKEINGESLVISYWPHPRLVIEPDCDLKLLNDLDEKLSLLNQFEIDHLWIIPFNRDFSMLSSQNFIQKYLIDTLSIKKLLIGYDHKFGKNREGSFEYLIANRDKYPFEIEEITRQTIDNLAFSSTLIRQHIMNGDIENANRLLGHPYKITGTVIKGLQNGRKLGYPTANIQIQFDHKLIPPHGVYAVKAKLSTQYVKYGMMNIGNRPTLHAGFSIEVHLFDFQQDIYGEEIEITIYKKLREEKQFDSLNLLTEQLKKDSNNTKVYFSEHENI